MDDLSFTATKRSPEVHQFAYVFSSLPTPDDSTIEGNNSDGVVDGNE